MEASKIAQEMVKILDPVCSKIVVVGSLRRMKKDIGDIDILTMPRNPKDLDDVLVKVLTGKVTGIGGGWQAIGEFMGIKINVLKSTPSAWGASILHATGPAEFNINLRSIAHNRGYLLNQWGLWMGDSWICGSSEEEIFRQLGFRYVEPQYRSEKNALKPLTFSDVEYDILSSDGKSVYKVMLQDGDWLCTHKWYKRGQVCKHILKAQEMYKNSDENQK
jgi:DNA polymerase/3'-5' exonuclease PolX